MTTLSIPMTGIDRSILSCRTFLVLFVLLSAPTAARCDTLEDSAKELARKIAATLHAGVDLYCEMRNASSLKPDELVRIDHALKGELQHQCVSSSVATASMAVTLSDNVENFVWTAEIRQDGDSRVVLLNVPHAEADSATTNTLPLNLSSEKFWEGAERPLDADKMSTPKGEQLVTVLLGDALVIRNPATNSDTRIPLPTELLKSPLREPSGTLAQDEKFVGASDDHRSCAISLDTAALVSCRDLSHDISHDGGHGIGQPIKGGQVVPATTTCSKYPSWFVTGTGDDTEPDSLKIVEWQYPNQVTVSNQLDFNGPIIAIHDALKFPRVIVRNLRTGNYEAYRISISCGQ